MPRHSRPSAEGPWASCEYYDPDTAQLFSAVFRQRERLATCYPCVSVQQPRREHAKIARIDPCPVGALIHLWARHPGLGGRCPECDGPALGIAFAGMLSDANIFGVCLHCALVVHRYYHGIGPILRSFDPLLADTRFRVGSGWNVCTGSGTPYTALNVVLRELGETDLPDPHVPGFAVRRAFRAPVSAH